MCRAEAMATPGLVAACRRDRHVALGYTDFLKMDDNRLRAKHDCDSKTTLVFQKQMRPTFPMIMLVLVGLAQTETKHDPKDHDPLPRWKPEPGYTKQALKKRVCGLLTLTIDIDETGKPKNIRVAHSLEESLDRNAIMRRCGSFRRRLKMECRSRLKM